MTELMENTIKCFKDSYNEDQKIFNENFNKCQENYQFNGHEIVELIDEIKQELEL